jgi:hypothetical protein
MKEWLENRLEELARIFAVAGGGFSVMNNHLHLLLRLDPEVARVWSDDEVVRRWGRLLPPQDSSISCQYLRKVPGIRAGRDS